MKRIFLLIFCLITTYVFAGDIPSPPNLRDQPVLLQQYLKTIYDNHNVLEITDSTPDGNIKGLKGKVILYNNSTSGRYELWVNTDGDMAWNNADTDTDTISGPAGGELAGTYPNPTIADNKIDNANMLDNAIHTAELYTDTGSQSGDIGATSIVEITMNDYSFSPNIYLQSAAHGDDLLPVDDDTSSTIGRFAIYNEADTSGYDVEWRYVKASDPERWTFAVFNKLENKIQHIWESGDHPTMTDPDAFPNPFEWLKGNPDYEIYLIDNKIWDELMPQITRTDRISQIIFNEYEIDKVSIPTFEGRILIELDEWGDRKGEIIKTYKNKTVYGKTKTLKRRMVNELPNEVKYRKLKKKD